MVAVTPLIQLFIVCALSVAKDVNDASSVTEVKTEVVYISLARSSFKTVWGRHWFSRLLDPRASSDCGPGLQSCDVEDPTRLEAPWHGVSSPFPQCYDPAEYVCASNFLCPVQAPKIEGQYACGSVSGQEPSGGVYSSWSSTLVSMWSSAGDSSKPVPTDTGCGTGLLSCDVEDPTRLEAPWHGVSAPFPQCYDPAAYVCSENFLCPIHAPKIPGQYACGPYVYSSSLASGSTGSSMTNPHASGVSLSTTSMSSMCSESSSKGTLLSSAGISGSSATIGSVSGSASNISNSGTASGSLAPSTTTGSTPAEVVIGGTTFLFPSSPTTITEPNGQSIILGPSGIIIGTDTIGFPSGTGPLAITTDGLTLTLEPGEANTPPASASPTNIVLDGSTFTIGTGFQTLTEANGETAVIGPSNIVIGSDTISFPSFGAILTTDGITLGVPSQSQFGTAAPTGVSTSLSPSSTGPLPVFSTWPSISVSTDTAGPITTGSATIGTHIWFTASSSSNPKSTGSPFAIWVPRFPCLICGCWFCPPIFSGFDFFGFPGPGIYPPPPDNIRPPGFSSNMPPITIGWDGNPTYSSEPNEPSTAASSTSPCSSVTATDCTDFVSFGVDTAGSTTASATSSQCTTTTGCSITGVTSTTFTTASCTVSSTCSTITACPNLFGRQVGTAACISSTACSPANTACPIATTDYVIYPVNQDSVTPITNILSNDFKIADSLILTASSEHLGFNYWVVPLTQAQISTLKGNSLIGSMYPVCTDNCYDPEDDAVSLADSEAENVESTKRSISERSTFLSNITEAEIYSKIEIRNEGLVRQSGAADELVHISLGPGIPLTSQQHNYVYDKTAGAGSTVYIIDTGANLEHPEFTSGSEFQTPRWLFPGTAPSTFEEDTGIGPNQFGSGVVGKGHGTAMLSKVSGYLYGIAKRTNNVIVKCPDPIQPECYQDALTKIYDDITDRSLTNVVISMSLYWSSQHIAKTAGNAWIASVRSTLSQLADKGVILVAGSGNGKLPTITGYPATFALKTLPADEQVPTLIVVAGTLSSGAIASFGSITLSNTDPNIDLAWAPGYDIQVADARYTLTLPDGSTAGPYRSGSGTSEAAASVAGLCAYFLGLDDIDNEIRPGPNPVDNAAAMKTYILEESYQRGSPANIKTVWNGVTAAQELNNPGQCPLRVSKRQGPGPDYPPCSRLTTISTPSTSSTTLSAPGTSSITLSAPGTSSTPIVPDVTMTFDAPSTAPTCQQPGLQQYLTSQGVTLPSGAPFLDIVLPIADQAGFWEVELGGPSDATSDITNWQVAQSGGPALNSGNGGASSFNWTNTQAPTGTQLELEMAPDLGIVIFEVTVTGRVDCVPPTPTPSAAASSTSPLETPAPTGFVIAGFTSSAGGSESIVVIPMAQIICEDVVAGEARYTAIALDYSKGTFDPPELSASQLPSATEWIVSQQENNSGFSEVCGISGLVIGFTSKGASGENILTWDDGRGTTGVCQSAVGGQEGCSSGGKSYTINFELFCQANGNPSYCANETPS